MTPGSRFRRGWMVLLILAGMLLRLLLLEAADDQLSALASGVVVASCLYICLVPLRLRLLSPPVLYLCVLALFHLGMAVPWGLDLCQESLPRWFTTNRLTPALALVTLAMLSYLAGVVGAARPTRDVQSDVLYTNRFLFLSGVAIYVTGCTMFFLGIHALGTARFFESGYGETYRLTAQFDPRLFGTSFTVVPIGLYLSAASFSRRWAPLVIALTLAWVLWIFYLGFRGFALIPGLVVFSLLDKRGYRMPVRARVAMVALVLAAIPLARATRDEGLRQRSLARSWSRVHLLDGIVEMGGSLRSLVHTLTSVDERTLRWGRTYWQSLNTVWPNFAPVWEGSRYIALEDLPPNHWFTAQAEPDMYRRHGGLGFSAVAEPYMNFGVAGVVLYFAAVGALLARSSDLASTRPLPLALVAMVLGPLLWTARNSFEVFFRPAVWGVLAALAAYSCAPIARAAGAWPRRLPPALPTEDTRAPAGSE